MTVRMGALLAIITASLFTSGLAQAIETNVVPARMEFQNVSEITEKSQVVYRALGEVQIDAPWSYVICNGLGGMHLDDRFEQLAREIKATRPEANVLLLDWSVAAVEKRLFSSPWKVAKKIDPVAREAAAMFQKMGLSPHKTTAIGESFGAYVIGVWAKELGGIEHLLAMNPANELGGYTPLDLRKSARLAWSFHTYSPFDTRREIAHGSLFLETREVASHWAQHTHGVLWLTERVAARDFAWLDMQHELPTSKAEAFHGEAGLQGELRDVVVPRQCPLPSSGNSPKIAAN